MRLTTPTIAALLVAALLAGPALAAGPPALTASTLGEAPQGAGVFRFPQAVTTSPGGSVVWVADQYSGVVQSFTADGTPRATVGARAARREAGRFGVIGGVATDRSNHLYVLDAENERVQVLASDDGHPIASFGDGTIFNLLGGDAATGAGISASGLAVFQANATTAPVVDVADAGNNRVARFPLSPSTLQPTGVTYSTVDLSAPQGLTLDPAGTRLFVADDDHHRVVVLDPETLAWSGQQVGSFGTGPGQFRNPYDVAVDSADPAQLYVADNLNNRVDVFDAGTLAFRTIFGRSGYGPGTGNMEIARAVGALADVPTGGVLAADTANNRIQSFAADGSVTAAWGLAGRGPGYVTRPSGVTFTPAGGVAIADTFDHRVALLDADGTFAGQRGLISLITGYAYAGSATGQLNRPSGIAYDASGNLWVADTGNNRVVELDANGAVLRTSAADLLTAPHAIASGPGGIYVTDDGGGRLLLLDAEMHATVVRTGLAHPAAVSVAPDGTVYVADDTSVRDAVSGVPVPGPGGSTTWDHPSGLAAGGGGLLFVAEQRPATANGARVVRRAVTAGAWDAIAGEGAGAANVIEPRGLALSADGATLLVADSGNNRALRFDAPGSAPAPRATLTVSINEPARGTVTSDLPGIACVTDCRQSYGQGRQVTLTAKPAAGSVITGWTGACADAGTARACTVALSGDRDAGVTFGSPPPPPPVVAQTPPPAPAPVPTPTPAPRAAVVISRVSMTRHLLHLARRTRTASAVQVTVTLTRPAALTVLMQRGVPGRRSASTCVRATRRRAKLPPCTRWISVPRSRSLARGTRLRTFTQRPAFGGRALRPGIYRLGVSAVDSDGNRTGPKTITFRVKR